MKETDRDSTKKVHSNEMKRYSAYNYIEHKKTNEAARESFRRKPYQMNK